MDEKTRGAAPETGKKRPRKRKKRLIWRRVILLLLLIAMAAGLVFFAVRGAESLFPADEDEYAHIEPYSYETGTAQVFAAVGEGLAAASSSSVQLMDSRGKTVYKQLVSFTSPAVFGCESAALFCDIGGKDVILAGLDGSVYAFEAPGALISASLNPSGFFTLISEQAGYKGLVEVYSSSADLVYRWWSGSGYALRAAVSPDCSSLAVLTVSQDGGKLQLFSLKSEEALWALSFPREVLFDLYFMNDDVICALSSENVRFISAGGEVSGSYGLSGSYINDYSFASRDFVALCLNSYRSGVGGTVISLDRSGNLLGSAEINRDIISMNAAEKQLIILTSGDVSLYSHTLALADREEGLMTAKDALICSGGKIFLLSAYAAERLKF